MSPGPDEQAIFSAISQATKLRSDGNGDDAATVSQSCEADLAAYPSPALLDHCVAFDAASGLLEGRGAQVRFQPATMAARHLRGAMRVSEDPVLAEERVTRVRQMVERTLLRGEPQPTGD
jgi:hypothetical protein